MACFSKNHEPNAREAGFSFEEMFVEASQIQKSIRKERLARIEDWIPFICPRRQVRNFLQSEYSPGEA